MKKVISALLACLLLLPTLAGNVSAASIGNCVTADPFFTLPAHLSNENVSGIDRYGVMADIQVSSLAYFNPCVPEDTGINASGAMVGLSYSFTGAYIHFGVIACNNGPANWPSSLCNSGRHIFIENQGDLAWDYDMYDMGPVNTGSNNFKLMWSQATGKWYFYVNGVVIKSFVNNGLNPIWEDMTWYGQFETRDGGDGLGTQLQAANIGNLRTVRNAYGNPWTLEPNGGSCDVADSWHHCTANGSYSMYNYTTN